MAGLGTLSVLLPELRIQIYSYVLLEQNKSVDVIPIIHRKLSEKTTRKRIERLNRRAAEGRPFKPVAVKAALLGVSKQISHEACPVLYGGYEFRLMTAQALDWFLFNIGENKQHIRDVCVICEIKMRHLRAVGRITNNLVDAKGLRSLTLSPEFIMYDGKMDLHCVGDDDVSKSDVGAIITKLASTSEKLLRTLHEAQKSKDKVAGVVDIFRLDFSPCNETSGGQLYAFWKSAVEDRTRESGD